MTNPNYQDLVASLSQGVTNFSTLHGPQLLADFDQQYHPFIMWIDYLRQYQRTGQADDLIEGLVSSIKESAGCLVLGLTRPFLFSLRGQIDLVLAWLFFKDHPVEWRHVNLSGENFKLKKEVLDYLSTYVPGFGARNATLRQIKTRREEDVYRLLSAHIHSQSTPVLPAIGDLSDVIGTVHTAQECIQLAREVSEYIGDILMSVFTAQWAALPAPIVSSLNSRFVTEQQKKTFYSGV